MRVYAIKLLEIDAESGNPEHLLHTVSTLADQLNHHLNVSEDIAKGQLQDLDDLINASMRYYTQTETLANPEFILMKMGFRKDQHQAIISLYQEALFYPLKRLHGRETAVKIVKSIAP